MSYVAPTPLPLPDAPLPAGVAWLRPWRLADAPDLLAAWREPSIARWTAVPEKVTLAVARRWISGDGERRRLGASLDLVIAVDPEANPRGSRRGPGLVAGEVGISHIDHERAAALVGYWVAPAHRGGGLAGAAVAALHRFVAEQAGVETLLARCHPENRPSIAAARAGGFTVLGEDDHGWLVLRSPPLSAPGQPGGANDMPRPEPDH